MKKILNFAIAGILVTALPHSFARDFTDDIIGNAIPISTCQELQDIHNSLDGNFELVNDIDCQFFDRDNNGKGFMPIGYSRRGSQPFTGNLNGNGYAIKNVFINLPTIYRVGLFAVLEKANISNLKLTDVDIVGGDAVGGLTGTLNSSSRISNITVTGRLRGNAFVGGLAGTAYSAIIRNSHTNVVIDASDHRAGGLAGFYVGGNITNSSAIGRVRGKECCVGGLIGVTANTTTISDSFAKVEAHGESVVGGLVGKMEGNNDTILNSYAMGSVRGKESVGGLVGRVFPPNRKSYIENSFSVGVVIGDTVTGGLIGDNIYSNDVYYSYWDTETSRQTRSAGGIPKTTAEMYQQGTYIGWDFLNTWKIDEGRNYPYLAWEDKSSGNH